MVKREELLKTMNMLMQEAKKEKSEDYRHGYVDGVLDFFNISTKADTIVKK